MPKVKCSVCKDRVDRDSLYRSQGMMKVCSETCFRDSYKKKLPTHSLSNKAPGRIQKSTKKKTGDPTPTTRKRVLKRDGVRCRMCGNPATNLHHIHYRSEHWPNMHEAHNLITLCVEDHMTVHSDKGYWQPVLLAAIWLFYTGETAKVSVPKAERLLKEG